MGLRLPKEEVDAFLKKYQNHFICVIRRGQKGLCGCSRGSFEKHQEIEEVSGA
jgi:hypothetical protein